MHKKCDLLARAGNIAEIGVEGRLRQHIGLGNNEVLLRVRLAAGPLDFYASMDRRNGNIEARIIRLGRQLRPVALLCVLASLSYTLYIGSSAFGAFGPGVHSL